ncbi:HEAT repeat domain-containing protein [Tolypothrix sp. FACHB-123]|uniref:protein kinase domain-containing protein n=1 Tax=Tolypothrix sp. FACHB-123 TaxID=2692868 RepID=UPI001687CC0A|nr:HEAT repeat domain-containing protein [Tolypothrix sp. FACHB-123]MBD2359165.1 HEAT repeat domain-containing protein [Tolypothrix sp. FACHB-123]
MALQIGDTISTRYKIIEELEEGGFGKIFIAEDLLKFNSKCVVKQFIQPYDEQSDIGQRATELFHKEAIILQDLEGYPQVPNLLAYFENEKIIVQELINGKNLLNELEQKTFDEKQILDLLSQLLPILKVIHERGIFHRDIKPDNIMRNQENGKLVLIDFGIAKQISELDIFTEKSVALRIPRSTNLGTYGYQAPENFSSPASDLYSLGATCFHLLTGYHPEYANERSWINVEMEVKKPTETILKKLFSEDLSTRYQNAEEVLQDIRATEDLKRIEKVEFLLSLLNATDERYRNQAINDLAEFGADASAATSQLINILHKDGYPPDSSVWNTLVKIGEESVPFLANLLQNERLDIRRKAASTLEQIGVQAKAAIPHLIRAFEDSDSDGDVRWYAVITIGKIGIPAKEAIPALIERLRDSKAGVRAWALYALGRMGDLAKEAESIILELLSQEKLNDVGNSVFIAGIEALDAIGFNIDEIQINSTEDNAVRTAREWVLLVREEALKSQKEARESARARGAIMLEYQRPLSAYTPPQKDPSQFREIYSN